MRSKLSQKRTFTIITNVSVVLYSLFLFMLKIYAFVGVFIAITALKGNKEIPNLHFEYLHPSLTTYEWKSGTRNTAGRPMAS